MQSTLNPPTKPAVAADARASQSTESDERDSTRFGQMSPADFPLRRRPLVRRVLQWIRRVHLYLGLFLFPWAVLYGFTGFLFNHPQVMSEQSVESFSREVWKGTPMDATANLSESAHQIVNAIQSHHSKSGSSLKLVESEPVRYASDFAIANIRTPSEDFSISIAVSGEGGTIRRITTTKSEVAEAEFPWAVGKAEKPRKGSRSMSRGSERTSGQNDKLVVEDSLVDHLQASIPNLARIRDLPSGELSINSVPDLTFVVESQGQRWKTSYNALKGTVTGKLFDAPEKALSWRRYLTKLHTAKGYPSSSMGSKWFWAIGVDLMAFVMIYWGMSGLLMWWQIKSTRKLGAVFLLFSAIAATTLAVGMHGVISAG